MNTRFRRWWWLLLLVPVVAGFLRLRLDVEVLNLLPANIPVVEGIKRYQQHFANAQDLIITLDAPDPDSASATAQLLAETLRGHPDLVSEVTWQPPWLEHPGQSSELIAYLWLNQPPSDFHKLVERLAETNLPNVLEATRDQLATTLSPRDIAQLSYDPFGFTRLPDNLLGLASGFQQGRQLFASADGNFRILFVRPLGKLGGYRECTAWLNQIRSIAKTALQKSKLHEVTLAYTGRPAFVAEISKSMRRDMIYASVGTAVLIALLFWLAHRRFRPLIWLLTLLGVILIVTLALGGLVFGSIHVISMGFAAILLGLAVDYAVVHYQEALAHPQLSVPQIRRTIAPSIFWAASTTIAAFLVLNLGGLPGLAQLGSLVAIGVGLSALVMIFAYLPPLFPERMRPVVGQALQPAGADDSSVATSTEGRTGKSAEPAGWKARPTAITAVLLLVSTMVLLRGLPGVDASDAALRPRHSQAYDALDAMTAKLGQQADPLWVLASGRNESEVARKLDRIEPILATAVSNQTLTSFTLPNALWPHPSNQLANSLAAQELIERRPAFRSAALAGGFSPDALGLANTVLDTWQRAAGSTNVFWPTNALCTWILDKLAAHDAGQFHAVGILFPATNAAPDLGKLENALSQSGGVVCGWKLLGQKVLAVVEANLWKLVLPMAGLVLLSLWLAFRRPAEILLSVASLLFSGLLLLAIMKIAGWSWNILNMMALPLILGTGVDYGIFMQHALRRHGGDLDLVRQSVGRALLLCGGTAIAGFGMLGLSSNAGMASLGQICAVGIACNMLLAVYLLPAWWLKLTGPATGEPGKAPEGPSSLYGAKLWSIGVTCCRLLPRTLTEDIARALSLLYCSLASHRRRVVIENLLPVAGNDRPQAGRIARRLFSNFGAKLVDLWLFEGGRRVAEHFDTWRGWEHFESASANGRGVLLVTPHLGNWEFGGPFMTDRGHKLLVLTQAEPDEQLTRLRQESRTRWGIETLVVGQDAFGFIEIIKRLQSGATVALLVDRPPAQTGVEVELFGQPFQASIAAAELARASGCGIVPVYVVRDGRHYTARMLPEVRYDRAAIGNREARVQLTQEIMRAFEPSIRQHADQWYHFVPVWRSGEG